MNTVLLTVCDEDHRCRLADMLESCEAVRDIRTSTERIPEADLWVADVATLRNREKSILGGEQSHSLEGPVPILLIAPRSWLSQPNPALWRQVDEVLCAPVRQPALEGRVQMLLRPSQGGEKRREEAESAFREMEGPKRMKKSRKQIAASERIAGLGSWERDLREEKLYWSEKTYRILGLSPEEPVPFETFIEAIHPEDRERLLRQQERLLEEGTPLDIEYRICRPDGEERIVQMWGEIDQRDDGTPVRVIGTMLDITERRQRAQRIERLRKKYKALLQGAPDAIVVADVATGRVVEANQAAASLLETSVEDLVGRHQSDLHPPEKKDQYRSLFEEYGDQIRTGAGPKQESVGRLPDGSQLQVVTDSGARVPIEINTTSVELGGREVYVGIFRDVRRRRKTERRQEILEQAVTQTQDAVFITDAEGTILYANPATEEITGYDREELTGVTPSLLQSDETSEETHEQLWSTIKQGEVFRNTITDRRKDGTLIELDQTVTPVEDERGRISHFVSTARDVTDRKRRARKLREAKEEAEEASRMKSTFLANMSHEIRTPLTSIIGFAEAAGTEASRLELPSSSSLADYARLIEKSGKRLLDTLEGVLNLSQLEAGQLELSPETVNLGKEVRRTAEELRQKARAQEVDLRLHVENEPVWVEANEGGVQIVTQNLLSNAIKYTEEGGTVQLRIGMTCNAAVLEVEDTGIGMNPEKAQELFEPFRQASEGFDRRYEGIGIGLAVTRKAVRQMDGSIDVETEKEEGTTFTVRLPKHAMSRSLQKKGKQET